MPRSKITKRQFLALDKLYRKRFQMEIFKSKALVYYEMEALGFCQEVESRVCSVKYIHWVLTSKGDSVYRRHQENIVSKTTRKIKKGD